MTNNVDFTLQAFTTVATLLGRYNDLLSTETMNAAERTFAARAAREEADVDYFLEEAPQALAGSTEGLTRITTIVRSLRTFAHPMRWRRRPRTSTRTCAAR